jgi:hypothetical protein
MAQGSGLEEAPDVELEAEMEREETAPLGPPPLLRDLEPDSRARITAFIIATALGGGSAPTAVMELYANLAGDEPAVRYADRRFMAREIPPDWRDIEERVVELDDAAHQRGVDLAAAWRRASGVAVDVDDPLEHLERLAGSAGVRVKAQRSIFDDPEDLDELEEDDSSLREAISGRLPDLADLGFEAQGRIRQYAIEEKLEHGLAPVEMLELYRFFEGLDDDRARQYLDRVFVDRELPNDWLDLQATVALDMVRERIELWRGRPADPTESQRW